MLVKICAHDIVPNTNNNRVTCSKTINTLKIALNFHSNVVKFSKSIDAGFNVALKFDSPRFYPGLFEI